MPNIDDKNIDENELLAAVRANLAEATEGEKKPEGEESAVKVDNPLDPDASKKEEPVVEAAAEVPAEPVVEATPAVTPAPEATPVAEQTLDIKSVLAGTELSEEFKEKAAIIFNTAVKMQVEAIASKLEEQFKEKTSALESSHEELKKKLEEKFANEFAESVQKFEETLSEKIDGYFGALSEEWMNENELALEGGIQAELVESFIGGMRSLFEQHYVEMPEEKRDLFSEANQKVAELEKSLAAQITESTEAKTALAKLQREKIIIESAHGMTELDASRFKTLMEDFEFDGEETFAKKAQTVKESFFKTKAALNESKTSPVEKPAKPQVTLVEETVIPVQESTTNPMDMYVKHIKGQTS